MPLVRVIPLKIRSAIPTRSRISRAATSVSGRCSTTVVFTVHPQRVQRFPVLRDLVGVEQCVRGHRQLQRWTLTPKIGPGNSGIRVTAHTLVSCGQLAVHFGSVRFGLPTKSLADKMPSKAA